MKKLLLYIRPSDAIYVRKLDVSRFASTVTTSDHMVSWTALRAKCRQLGADCVATTHYPLWNSHLEGTRDDNMGYTFERDGIVVLLIPDLARIYQQAHMQWLINHYLCKLSNPEVFITPPTFVHRQLALADADVWLAKLNSPDALLCAIDIETKKEGLLITSIAYTLITQDMRSESAVINLMDASTNADNLLLMKLLCRSNVPKVMHNGRYDCSYLLRFNSVPVNYVLDTYHMQHCLYSELPKTLAFCSQMYLIGIRYWKEMSGYSKLEYNARDTHSTAWAMLGMLHHIKWRKAQYALRNYSIEFPLVFPCIHVGMDGLAIDEQERLRLRGIEVVKADTALARIRYVLGIPNFNPSSPKQVLALLHAMGYKVAKNSDVKTLQHFAERGQLEVNLVRMISAYREATKAIGTYYDTTLMNGRLMYSLDPAGTETGRMASKSSNFWCGTQIQNIPAYAKSMVVPDSGWQFFSVDGSQAESRCTAYISGDEQLIHNVETSPDFHCTNCSLFFGIPFNELYRVGYTQPEYYDEDGTFHPAVYVAGKVLRKDIRNVGKRVNHGANYNMGAHVMWETMGDKEVFYAARMLDLPLHYDATRITKQLLSCFNQTYPAIKGDWYGRVVDEVMTTGMLVGATGWTRRTFLKPTRSKPEINACVAHPPQSLSVMGVNKAFLAAWKLQIGELAGRLRLKAQIHDEVFGLHRPNDSEVPERIGVISRQCNTVVINGRTMVIPNEPKYGANRWSELKD